jgi:hypothetical protein
MGNKVQGEGDYESARKYNEATREFVKDQEDKGAPMKGDASQAQDKLTAAEKEALAHAKHGEQDKRDADLLKKLETKR